MFSAVNTMRGSLADVNSPTSIEIRDQLISSLHHLRKCLSNNLFKITSFFVAGTISDHLPSTAALGSTVYNGKDSPKQQLVKNNLPALTRPSVLGTFELCV